MNPNQNKQNYQSDIPKGRSTSRIKNASQSQGFANKDLYGPSVQSRTASRTNQYNKTYRTSNTGQRASKKRNPYMDNARRDKYKNTVYNKPFGKNSSNNNIDTSESTIVKVIIGSILAAVLLAIVIIIALVFMDFHL